MATPATKTCRRGPRQGVGNRKAGNSHPSDKDLSPGTPAGSREQGVGSREQGTERRDDEGIRA